ncbi:MAG TPA: protoporphyrinogen oxidase [Coleofasciculaceae cyanobacterium]|jgi:oxygen-dependent protoporphyrinogen oxidase
MSSAETIIIGAGISGLVAANQMRKNGRDVRVLEAGSAPGGLIRTLHEDGFTVEGGPNTFPSSAGELLALCEELGLTPKPASPLAQKRYLYLQGRLTALPGSPLEALTTPVLSLGGKLAFLKEPWQPKSQAEELSIADFFRQRLGAEAVERLVDPFISGIYAGDIRQLSLPAVFPRLWQWEQEHGSLIRGAMAARTGQKKSGQVKSGKRKPMQLLSFENGLQSLTDALVRALPANALHLNTRVQAITQTEQGFRLSLYGGETLSARQVILATPADVAAQLLQTLVPQAAQSLAQVTYNRVAVVHAGFKKSDLPHPLDGFGCLIPRRENLALLGSIWASSLFPERAPEGHVLLSNFIGGAHHPEIPTWAPEQIQAQVLADLGQMFGSRQPLQPVFSKVLRYERAIPQYALGHRERIQAVEAALASHPNLALCGNYLHGLAINECIKSGLAVAERLTLKPVAHAV